MTYFYYPIHIRFLFRHLYVYSPPFYLPNPVLDLSPTEATLHLKGVTLRARDASGDLMHSINLCADELAVQVKRHRDKRRKRRESRVAATEVLPGDVTSAA